MGAIKELRERANMTQKMIADALETDRSTVAKWEAGESFPRADKLPQLARLLGCTIDELFEKGGLR